MGCPLDNGMHSIYVLSDSHETQKLRNKHEENTYAMLLCVIVCV